MARFLIDVNLPYYFSLWKGDEFIHMKDIGETWSDTQIWNYAKENNLTIITKDSDFSHRIIFAEPPPKVIHIRFGNIKMRDFFLYINTLWNEIVMLNKDYKLINVFRDRIEAIE
jgi:predicted nuclease of predicted toxin-antitoxin system